RVVIERLSLKRKTNDETHCFPEVFQLERLRKGVLVDRPTGKLDSGGFECFWFQWFAHRVCLRQFRLEPAAEKDGVNHEINRKKNRDRVTDEVAHKGRHVDAVFLRNGLNHEVRRIADVRHGSEEHSSDRYGLEEYDRIHLSDRHREGSNLIGYVHVHSELAHRRGQEVQVGRRVIEDARKHTCRPVNGADTERFRVFLREVAYQLEGWLHGGEDAEEQP